MNVNVLETRNGQFPPKQKLECKITLKFPSYKWQNDESKHSSSSHRTLIIDEISYVAQIWNRTSGSASEKRFNFGNEPMNTKNNIVECTIF